MADKAFDPYHKWLGIPPEEQPASHYQLLGLKLFEDDINVIEAAANRQMAYVKQCGTGPYSDISQEVLDQLSSARGILLNADRKDAYDTQLKWKLQPKTASSNQNRDANDDFEDDYEYEDESSFQSKLGIVFAILFGAITAFGSYQLFFKPNPNGPAGDQLADSNLEEAEEFFTEEESMEDESEDFDDTDLNDDQASSDSPTRTSSDDQPESPTIVSSTDTNTSKESETETKKDTSADSKEFAVAVNLLGKIDPQSNSVNGKFSLENGRLSWQETRTARLQIPYSVPPEYDLVVTSSRLSGEGLSIGLPVGGYQALTVIDGFRGSGLHYLDGENYFKNETAQKEKGLFQAGKESTVICSVRKSRVKITFDGKTLIDWKGDPARFKDLKEWSVPDKEKIFLGGMAAHSISRLEIKLASPPKEETKPTEPTKPDEPTPVVAERKPLPDAETLKEAELLIKELFKDEFAVAKRPEEKYELAKKLLEQGLGSSDDEISKYVLLREAHELAIDAGMAVTALSAIEEISHDFDIDLWEAREKTLSDAASHARFAEQNQSLIEVTTKLIDEAIAEDRYELAVKLVNMTVTAGRKVRDKNLSTQLSALRTEVTDLKKDFDTAQKAAETLKENPDDPEANFAWGTYLCFQRNDWASGLPLLAKSGNDELKTVIELDLANPTESSEQIELADAWWNWIESSKQKENQKFRVSAQYWYKKAAQDEIKGLAKLKVDKRLEEIGDLPKPRTETASSPQLVGTKLSMLSTGLVAHWNFEEGQGTNVADSSGKGNNGILKTKNEKAAWSNETPPVSSAGKKSLTVNDRNHLVQVPNTPSLNITDAITISAWVKIHPKGSFDPDLVIKGGNNSYRLTAGGLFILGKASGEGYAGTRPQKNAPKFPKGKWYHILARYDGKMLRVFLNGIPTSEGQYTGKIKVTPSGVTLARNSRGMMVDDIRIYNRALSDEEVAFLAGK